MLTNIANYIHEKFLRYLILKIFLIKLFYGKIFGITARIFIDVAKF